MTALISDFQKVSEISDDFQLLLSFDLLIRNINIENNLFEKNIEIEQTFVYNKTRSEGVHMDYKGNIIKMLQKINDEKTLAFIYKIICNLLD